MLKMQWMLTLRLNTFLLFTTPHNHTHKVFLIDVLISHTLPNSLNSMPWDLALQPFFNLAISFMNPAGYWKCYPVPVLVEHAHVKEREHEKHVVQTAKIRKVPKSWYSGTAVWLRSTRVFEYRAIPVPSSCAG